MKEVKIIYHSYLSPPLAEVVLYPQFIFMPISKLIVFFDEFLFRLAPNFLRPLS